MYALLFVALAAVSQPPKVEARPTYERKEDVIYGRKFGTALTLDVYFPKEKNGAGVIFAVSGGWFSSKEMMNLVLFEPFLKRGYVVFAVLHGSQPRFSIPEVLDDMHRATRYVRHRAKDYGVDANRIGIAGASAGGHLSLMQGCTGKPGDPKAKDPVDRESSKVAAVACFFPPTDFLNYGKEGQVALGDGILTAFRAPFDFIEFDDKSRAYNPVTDPAKRKEIGRKISPVYHVTAESAPALIIHGAKDELVPIQQAERMISKLKEAKVPCELVVRPEGGHGWMGFDKDLAVLADWFDKHLKK